LKGGRRAPRKTRQAFRTKKMGTEGKGLKRRTRAEGDGRMGELVANAQRGGRTGRREMDEGIFPCFLMPAPYEKRNHGKRGKTAPPKRPNEDGGTPSTKIGKVEPGRKTLPCKVVTRVH